MPKYEMAYWLTTDLVAMANNDPDREYRLIYRASQRGATPKEIAVVVGTTPGGAGVKRMRGFMLKQRRDAVADWYHRMRFDPNV